jgi:hypothetical protein
MFCDRCGIRLHDAASFCPSCGKPAGTTPLMPPQGRLAGHIRLLGIFWLALSALRVIPGLVLIFLGSGRLFLGAPPLLYDMLSVIGWILLPIGAIGAAVGWGLLARQSWARMPAIIFGAINLPDIPFGTALGIYGLWVLLPAESEQAYRTMSRAA